MNISHHLKLINKLSTYLAFCGRSIFSSDMSFDICIIFDKFFIFFYASEALKQPRWQFDGMQIIAHPLDPRMFFILGCCDLGLKHLLAIFTI